MTLFSKDFDLVIMDVGLPGIDGVETTKKLRELDPEAKTPIIAHTAHGDEVVRKKCFAAGMSHFLTKADSLETFNRVVAEAIVGGVMV